MDQVTDSTNKTTQEAPGKRALIEAALRLVSHSRSLSSIGLRELAREAELNPNTFYRHFATIDELGLAIIEDLAQRLRQPLRQLRRQAAARSIPGEGPNWIKWLGVDLGRARRVIHETVQLFFDFVLANPEAFIIGVRELHGASPVLREALAEVMEQFAEDMAEDILDFKLLPLTLSDGVVRHISRQVSHGLFQQSLDVLTHREQHKHILQIAEEQILMLFTGALVLDKIGQLKLPK